ncbi:hypothetical protein ACHAWF_008549 [Thalassiosira exigua]
MTAPEPDPAAPSRPPPAAIILACYVALGSIISFLFGREPGTLPDDVAGEMAPSIVVACGFLTSYSLWDVMAVGEAKSRYGGLKSYDDLPVKIPEEIYLSQRAQANQVEQMPLFFVGMFCCALLVDGKVAGVLGLTWSVLRRMYASAYRNGVGKRFAEMGLAKFTIPCYFIANGMAMAALIQSVRSLLQ